MQLHLDDGELKACCDEQLNEGDQSRVMAHLEECGSCRSRFEALQGQAERARLRLSSLDPGGAVRLLPSTPAARARFAARLSQKEKENQNMFRKIFSRPFRPALAALALVLVVGLALSVPSVRAMAVNFLEIFRVKQIAVIPVNPANIKDSFKDNGPSIQSLLDDSAKYETSGKPKDVQNAAEASQQAGFSVRMPASAEPLHKLTVLPSTKGTLTLDVPRINQILKEMNRSDLNLDASLDKTTIVVDVPQSVSASFGACKNTSEKAAAANPDQEMPLPATATDCTILVQMPSPEVSTPPGLDVKKLGAAFLEVSGMPADKAKSMADKIDWTNTLVIPLPIDSSSYSDVQVDGVTGTLVRETEGRAAGHYVLIWVRDGILYGVSGNGATEPAVELANSLH